MNPTIKSIVLVRHARSIANDDPTVYRRIPDHAIPLAEPESDAAALAAARAIAALGLDPARTCVWCSTYLRCAQTEALVLAHAFGEGAARVRRRESFLLREQEFGDWDGLDEAEMAAQDPERYEKRRRMSDLWGRFYFRYLNGESRADVVQRMAVFIGKIHRSQFDHHLVFLHGVTQRAFRMAWLNRSPAWFEHEQNPPNASVLRVHRDDPCGMWGEEWLAEPPVRAASAVGDAAA
jgi:2,3-bisphosphoglycerate-dependent phosphoglycerate mutase